MKKILLLMILCVPVFSGISAQEVLRRPATLLEDEKKLQVERYENALTGLKDKQMPRVPPEAVALVQSHLAELRNELSSLESAAQQINSRKKV